MLPAFLITFREVIEAALIVVTILGILVKLHQGKGIKTVMYATTAAAVASIALVGIGSLLGFQMQKLYSGRTEELIEGVLMILSAVFITWAVFFLHKSFSRYKIHLLKSVKEKIETEEQKGLFFLVFTAVFREGFEIALFLSTIYFSSNPTSIFIGFTSGALVALVVSFALFTSLVKLPLHYAFRTTSILLVLFAAGLLGRGAHEFTEVGFFPEMGKITLAFIPHTSSFMGSLIQIVFGLTKTMDAMQLVFYSAYTLFMIRFLFFKRKKNSLPA
ncbi:hypothetical protein A3G67_03205 [Candidatus Roizmanbacteria bacterium RIFCSPLOWO2_12_FULL_40_12]|uniref:Iron permease n=1 Tax=Candidatus Roizmanbacteria bacterium RIFCSPLOWO2_01_FULL_40_42 TaxID=1802066 RepID=A0A1F7J5E3_9BACT|nr:MAG: hypothetical protein A2779_02840 [Candidatus Roizmanbacteria bacterium RIFCSPHIGHO2_01_FULL_40_98]OGK28278.1 MAG: hypothetical protein A3C31_00205 [Candidatus Roizmanbacteria bacterium RIFCSPHIGHO2_02_FULL_40_53]OGK30514.1 MAG: hypothetical protein A2W49_02890 [Candidatus Roizmanbacteria bacterium RIFCSPHIGHO2_12_41_18]OGK36928.1 MAG: hypothetical protein A3E69_00465 [Candidatus Roizmanbacteria bacterium RIFCSPHIGHO2_12_FULL_40_130]OGK50834.1 MAG: hypothetical protein A3B50_00975 [Candi